MGETTVGHVAGEVVRALYGAGYMVYFVKSVFRV